MCGEEGRRVVALQGVIAEVGGGEGGVRDRGVVDEGCTIRVGIGRRIWAPVYVVVEWFVH